MLSDLAPASLPTWVTLYQRSQCWALVFSLFCQHCRVPGTWLYLFFSWDPFSPRLSQACALTSDGGLLRGHVLRGSTTTPSVVPPSSLPNSLSHLPCHYLTPETFHFHLILALLFVTSTDCKPHVGWDFGRLVLSHLGVEHSRIYLSIYHCIICLPLSRTCKMKKKCLLNKQTM